MMFAQVIAFAARLCLVRAWDHGFVRTLVDALADLEIGVWVDWEGLAPSTEWRLEIERAIDAAGAFVFIVSRHSVQSTMCLWELERAYDARKRLVPFILESVTATEMPELLAKRQWISCLESNDFTAAANALRTCLLRDPEAVRIHTRLIERAREWMQHERSTAICYEERTFSGRRAGWQHRSIRVVSSRRLRIRSRTSKPARKPSERSSSSIEHSMTGCRHASLPSARPRLRPVVPNH